MVLVSLLLSEVGLVVEDMAFVGPYLVQAIRPLFLLFYGPCCQAFLKVEVLEPTRHIIYLYELEFAKDGG